MTRARRRGGPLSPGARRTIVAMLLLAGALLGLRELEPLLTFRAVDAIVESSDVRRAGSAGTRGRRRPRYAPNVVYRYVVDGRTWTSNTYAWSARERSREDAEEKARRFVPGARVQAWYNPRNHRDAVLSRDPNLHFVLIAWVFAFVLWLAGRFQRPKPRPQEAAAMPASEPMTGRPPPIE